MNKVYLMGSIFDLENELGNAGKIVTRFTLKTKKLVGYGNSWKKSGVYISKMQRRYKSCNMG